MNLLCNCNRTTGIRRANNYSAKKINNRIEHEIYVRILFGYAATEMERMGKLFPKVDGMAHDRYNGELIETKVAFLQ